jgi:hypothetical protein
MRGLKATSWNTGILLIKKQALKRGGELGNG